MILLSQNKNIVIIYILCIVSVLMNFVPSITIQTLGGFLFLFAFIMTYVIRGDTEEGSVRQIHCNYIIKTVWIFSLLFIIGTIISTALADHTAIMGLVNSINAGVIPTHQTMMEVVKTFGLDNLILFLIIFLPMVIYLLYRFGKGVLLARKDKTPSNPKGWL